MIKLLLKALILGIFMVANFSPATQAAQAAQQNCNKVNCHYVNYVVLTLEELIQEGLIEVENTSNFIIIRLNKNLKTLSIFDKLSRPLELEINSGKVELVIRANEIAINIL